MWSLEVWKLIKKCTLFKENIACKKQRRIKKELSPKWEIEDVIILIAPKYRDALTIDLVLEKGVIEQEIESSR